MAIQINVTEVGGNGELQYNTQSTPGTFDKATDVIALVDKGTGENVNYRETTTWHDGSQIDDSKVDGVLYVKKNGKFYKRSFIKEVSVRWFGAKGDGATDDTAAFQAAVNSGFPIYIEKGEYLIKSAIVIPYEFRGLTIRGAGFDNWSTKVGSAIVGESDKIFKFNDGANFIKIENLRLDGRSKCGIGLDLTFGVNVLVENVGVYNFTQYGIKSRQGLLRVSNCFIANNKVGFSMYSDASLENSELTGGDIPLEILAGGNRLNNVWINGSFVNLVSIRPLDENTNHQNTSFSNCYIGEVYAKNGDYSDKIAIAIEGNSVRRVQQIQFSNSFIVHGTDTENANTIFSLKKCDEIILDGLNVLGKGEYMSPKSFTKAFLTSDDANAITISSNIIKGINCTAIEQSANSFDWQIIGNKFIGCAGHDGKYAIINSDNESGRTQILMNQVIDTRGNQEVYFLETKSSSMHCTMNSIYYPNAKITNDPRGINKYEGNHR